VAPLILAKKKEEMTEGRKAGRASKTKPAWWRDAGLKKNLCWTLLVSDRKFCELAS